MILDVVSLDHRIQNQNGFFPSCHFHELLGHGWFKERGGEKNSGIERKRGKMSGGE